ncbi:prolipoprotein diacylglyceryl transferase [Patescibacteria group bacterium]|nr:prolipoprotein diacylglyceryl transferase [Patescibacteria group bacterium]
MFLYEWYYYAQHRDEILMIREGGMSFIGGVIGVTLGLGRLMRRRKMSLNDLLLLGDIILCIVPIGITLGRIGNYLNQELR